MTASDTRQRFTPQWLQGMVAPTACLWCFILACAVATVLGSEPGELSAGASLAARFAQPFILAWWVMSDARKRGRALCYDFDSFVFFAWPVVVPVYLFQTRGWRAVLTLLCFGGLWAAGGLLGAALALVFS